MCCSVLCSACADTVAKLLAYGPMLAEHCVLRAGLLPSRKPAAEPLADPEIDALMREVRAFDRWLAACKANEVPPGFILLKPLPQTPAQKNSARTPAPAVDAAVDAAGTQLATSGEGGSEAAAAAERTAASGTCSAAAPAATAVSIDSTAAKEGEPAAGGPSAVARDGCPEGWVYADFDPLLLQQKEGIRRLEFPSFDAALDEFFSKVPPPHPLTHQHQPWARLCSCASMRFWRICSAALLSAPRLVLSSRALSVCALTVFHNCVPGAPAAPCLQIEEQRGAASRAAAAQQAITRVNKVQAGQEQKIVALEKAAAAAERSAEAIEGNLEAVNAVLAAVNTQLATGVRPCALASATSPFVVTRSHL